MYLKNTGVGGLGEIGLYIIWTNHTLSQSLILPPINEVIATPQFIVMIEQDSI